jgi:hypothetical protein
VNNSVLLQVINGIKAQLIIALHIIIIKNRNPMVAIQAMMIIDYLNKYAGYFSSCKPLIQ